MEVHNLDLQISALSSHGVELLCRTRKRRRRMPPFEYSMNTFAIFLFFLFFWLYYQTPIWTISGFANNQIFADSLNKAYEKRVKKNDSFTNRTSLILN